MTQKSTVKIVCLLSFLFLFGTKGFSQTTKSITCPVVDDATISQYQNWALGKQSQLVCYPWWHGYRRRFLVKFDMSQIPEGAKIISAKIQLRMSRIAGNNTRINAHLSTVNWNENTVTWLKFANQFNRTVSATRYLKWTGSTNTLETWDVTQDVQAMADGTIDNFGWLFKEPTMNSNAWFFHSKQGPSNLKPKLKITYELPEPHTAPLVISSTHKNISCTSQNDGEASVIVTGGTGDGYEYSWSPSPKIGQGTKTASGLEPGFWFLTVTDAGDIENKKTIEFEITEPNELMSTAVSKNESCGGCQDGELTIIANGGTAPFSISIDGSETYSENQTYTGLTSKEYNVVVKDANNCLSAPHIINVGIEPLSLTSTAIFPTNQNNGSIDLTISGGTSPYLVSWSNGAITEDISELFPGEYTVNVMDQTGSYSHTSVKLVPPLTWEKKVNVEINPQGKIASQLTSWGSAYAQSSSSLALNTDGEVSMQIHSNDLGHQWSFGLSTKSAASSPIVEYAIKNWGNGQGYDIQYNGAWIASSYITPLLGDQLVVKRVDSQIEFYINGILITTQTCNQTYELVADFEIKEPNVVLSNSQASFQEISAPSAPTSKNYFLLSEELSGDYAFTENDELTFLFKEPYSIPKNLDYKVYDNINSVAIDGAQNTILINPGYNKISLDVSGLQEDIIYTLEVQVTPNEKKYLKFKL